MTLSTEIYVVGAAIINDSGEILAARRGPAMSLPGAWEFPGGKVEPGERPEESLVRELREELDVEVEVLDFVARGEAPAGARTVVLDVYRCRLVTGEPRLIEHDALLWLAPSELDSITWAEADLPAVAALSQPGGSAR